MKTVSFSFFKDVYASKGSGIGRICDRGNLKDEGIRDKYASGAFYRLIFKGYRILLTETATVSVSPKEKWGTQAFWGDPSEEVEAELCSVVFSKEED